MRFRLEFRVTEHGGSRLAVLIPANNGIAVECVLDSSRFGDAGYFCVVLVCSIDMLVLFADTPSEGPDRVWGSWVSYWIEILPGMVCRILLLFEREKLQISYPSRPLKP